MMGFRPRTSVRHKLLAIVLLSTLAAVGFSLAAMVAYDLTLYHRSWIADVNTQAALLGRTSAAALAFDDPSVARENLELLRSRPKIRAAAIYNAKGALFARFSVEPDEVFPTLPGTEGTRVEANQLIVFSRITDSREILGTVYLRADYDLWNRLFGYLGIAFVVASAALLVAYALLWRLQRSLTLPLRAIGTVAHEVTENRNFSLRAEKLSDDEIGALADNLNAMLSTIEETTGALEREVSDRRAAEEEIKRLNADLESRVRERTAELQYANSELEAFSSSVSHDLRAPLRAIHGFSQALQDEFPEQLPSEAHRYLSRIRSSTERMAQLIEDLLNLSRVSRVGLTRRDVDVSELARTVVAGLRQQEPGRNVEVIVWDDMHAHADQALLRAALENLISNAWKFTSRAAQARIEVGSLRDGGRTTFFVRDNGAGFDMKYSDKLFGPFQRLHAITEYPGTGIGLATVQRIMHRHGGRAWADAHPGKGAVFFFTLESGPSAEGANDAQMSA